jgi:hypothetical protein
VLSSPKPRTSPTAAPASLETRGSRLAFRHSNAMRTVALMAVITVPATPGSRSSAATLDPASASHDLDHHDSNPLLDGWTSG